ncbi:MAG: spermidine/putrescine transport system permease protein [Chloroflexota bacterium]|jgi:spermidine/putrescine transport system permease protein|nr:spermidine/putrescine transport system permease protein [Chloroflexota bacterium]
MTAAGDARRPSGGGRRGALLTGVLMLPASFWYLGLLIAPLVIVVIYSFGVRAKDGGYAPAFTFDNYQVVATRFDPFLLTLGMAVAGTALCALVAFPLAYFIATRVGRRKSLMIVLLVVPFWTSFLIRTIAWLTILGPSGIAGFLSDVTGQDVQILGTPFSILLGIVYNYLPLMIFPLYVTLERLDRTLLEASKDLGAGRWATFRQITLPIILPGVITGSILVFIPLMGEYVIPALLGRGKVFLVGNVLQLDFLSSRNWPAGSAKAVVLILIMLVSVSFYVWFTNRGRRTRDVSVL